MVRKSCQPIITTRLESAHCWRWAASEPFFAFLPTGAQKFFLIAFKRALESHSSKCWWISSCACDLPRYLSQWSSILNDAMQVFYVAEQGRTYTEIQNLKLRSISNGTWRYLASHDGLLCWLSWLVLNKFEWSKHFNNKIIRRWQKLSSFIAVYHNENNTVHLQTHHGCRCQKYKPYLFRIV